MDLGYSQNEIDEMDIPHFLELLAFKLKAEKDKELNTSKEERLTFDQIVF